MEREKGEPLNDCDAVVDPQGHAFKSIMAFAVDEEEWLKNYHLAWKFATENGHPNLTFIDQKARLRAAKFCSKSSPRDAQPFDCETAFSNRKECVDSYQCNWEEIEEKGVVDRRNWVGYCRPLGNADKWVNEFNHGTNDRQISGQRR